LGWDIAALGRSIDTIACNADVLDGYKAGKLHFPRPQRHRDRYEIKWIQLRLGALSRHRIVQPEITPHYLEYIDADVCPVSLIRLTHSTQNDTDWSVDRINNSGAYADANLMVISTRVNRVKNDKTYDEVRRLADNNTSCPALSQVEWRRLACLMYGAHHLEGADDTRDAPGPLFTGIPRRCRAPLYFHFQQALLSIVREAPARNLFVKVLNARHPDASQRQRLVIGAERLALLSRDCDFLYDALADDRVQSCLNSWFLSFPEDMLSVLIKIASAFGRPDFDEGVLERWALLSKGYFTGAAKLASDACRRTRPANAAAKRVGIGYDDAERVCEINGSSTAASTIDESITDMKAGFPRIR
jgi:hypothetical protein